MARGILICSLAVSTVGCWPAAPPTTGPVSTLDKLDARQIPAEERFAWQPKELVAVIGSHRWRSWGVFNIAVAFSPSGTTIATGGNDRFVRVWDMNGHETSALEHNSRSVNALAFSPDGRMLLAGVDLGDHVAILAWDLRASPPSPLPPLEPSRLPAPRFGMPLQPAVDSIAFSGDGKRLACTVGRQTGVRLVLWDATAWPPRELPALSEATGPFAFSSDGKTLVTQHGQGGILVWDLTGAQPRRKAAGRLRRPRNQMLTMVLGPDGRTAATCHGDKVNPGGGLFGEPTGDVVLWDLTVSPPRPKTSFGSFKLDMMYLMTPAAAFSPDGKTFVFADSQSRIELWDVTTDPPKQRAILPGQVNQSGTLAFAPDGKTLAAVGGGVLVWDLSGPTPRRKDGQSPWFGTVVVSPDGRRLAIAEAGATEFTAVTRLWDLTGATPQRLPSPIDGVPVLFGTDGILLTAEYATPPKPAEQGVAPRAQPPTLRRWDISGKEPRAVGAADAAPVSALRLQGPVVMTGHTLLGDEQGPESLLWRLDGAGQSKSCRLPVPRETRLDPTAASADGTVFAASMGDSNDRVVKVWDVSGDEAREKASVRGAPLPTVPRYDWGALALSPDGRAVALTNGDGTVPVWTLAQGEPRPIATLRGREPGETILASTQLAFSADGRRLLATSGDALIVWDISAGQVLDSASFPGGTFGCRAAFAPDGRHVITANPDGTVYILRLPEGR